MYFPWILYLTSEGEKGEEEFWHCLIGLDYLALTVE